jgi:hypothetical protein
VNGERPAYSPNAAESEWPKSAQVGGRRRGARSACHRCLGALHMRRAMRGHALRRRPLMSLGALGEKSEAV